MIQSRFIRGLHLFIRNVHASSAPKVRPFGLMLGKYAVKSLFYNFGFKFLCPFKLTLVKVVGKRYEISRNGLAFLHIKSRAQRSRYISSRNIARNIRHQGNFSVVNLISVCSIVQRCRIRIGSVFAGRYKNIRRCLAAIEIA